MKNKISIARYSQDLLQDFLISLSGAMAANYGAIRIRRYPTDTILLSMMI